MEDDEIELPGTWSPELWLPQRPVVTVSAVAVNALAIPVGGFTWSIGGQLYRGPLPVGNAAEADDEDPRISGWGGPRSKVTVTYSHGFEEIPGDVVDLCLAVAARILANPDDAQSETIGEYSHTDAHAGTGAALTEDEKKTCARFRRDVRSISAGR